jgi:hemerythrin
MVYVEWSKEMETGFDVIDAQHKALVKMINEIAAALEGVDFVDPEKTIESNLRQLLDYTIVHFNLEESLMQESRFDGFQEHKSIHANFRSRIEDLFAELQRGEDVAFQLLGELRVWLVSHIQGTDMKYVETLKSNLPSARLDA